MKTIGRVDVAGGVVMVAAVLTKGTLRAVPFRLDGRLVTEAHSVALVASFNRWDTSVHWPARNPTDRGRCR